MKSDNDTDQTSKKDGGNGVTPNGVTPSTALLNRILGTSPTPRMLTPYEIQLLRQSAQEMSQVAHEVFARKDKP